MIGSGVPALQLAGVSMALNLGADHLGDTLSGDEFSSTSHVVTGVVGAVTPSITGGTGFLIGKIPAVKQSGVIMKKAAELAGEGLMDGALSSAGKVLESSMTGTPLPTAGNIGGEFVGGLLAAPFNFGGQELGGYFQAGLAAEGVSDTWSGYVSAGIQIEFQAGYEAMQTMFSYGFERTEE